MAKSGSLSYLFQLQNTNYQNLAAQNFRIAVVDADDAELTASQVGALRATGKTVFSYLSVGEAEDYRDYWIQGNWSAHKPSFVLRENENWEGNYKVKFWDAGWQKLMIGKAVDLAKAGYSGMYLDIIDAYQEQEVINAWGGSEAGLRQEMINFVIKLSAAVKAIDPGFKVIPQNAVELLALHPDNPAVANQAYLKAIDGVGKEDTWTDGNAKVAWTEFDLQYLKLATANGKFVLSIDYATKESLQQEYVQHALDAGFIPFIGNRALNGKVDDTNYLISSKISPELLGKATGAVSSEVAVQTHLGGQKADTLYGTGSADKMEGLGGNDRLLGGAGNDLLKGGEGKDRLYGQTGNDTLDGGAGNDAFYFGPKGGHDVITHFDNPGNKLGDMIYIAKNTFATKAEILHHISYAHGDATLDLGIHGSVTIEDIAANSLTIKDFGFY